MVPEYPSRVPEPFGGEGVWEATCGGDWGYPGPILGKRLWILFAATTKVQKLAGLMKHELLSPTTYSVINYHE